MKCGVIAYLKLFPTALFAGFKVFLSPDNRRFPPIGVAEHSCWRVWVVLKSKNYLSDVWFKLYGKYFYGLCKFAKLCINNCIYITSSIEEIYFYPTVYIRCVATLPVWGSR